MPVGLAASDRKLLLIGGVVLVILLTASVLLSPPGDEGNSPIPSTYSAQSGGAQAAYLLLSRLRYPVRRWEDSPTELKADENALLILAEPVLPPSAKEREALADFVKDGGHILFTGDDIRAYFPDADLSNMPVDSEEKPLPPDIPNHLLRGGQYVSFDRRAAWGKLNESQIELFGGAESPAVVLWKLGDGEILWWANATPLTNAGIMRADNLAFFLNSVANWSADEPYQIYWDEYFHGQRSSLWSYVGKTSLAWSFLQLAILGMAVLFTFSRRSGPVFVPPGVSRLSPLEFVDTLGGLYERAGAASSAVSVSYARLRSLLTRQLGLPANTPYDELALAANQRLGWKDAKFAGLLQRAEVSSRMVKLKSGEALGLVQELERYAAMLDVRAQFRREKI